MALLLHFSDLHRDPSDPISNDMLIHAIVSDFERFRKEKPGTAIPDGALISGDLILGAALEAEHPDATIDAQRREALDFLRRLCKEFFDGDASRVVLSPGNHDVDWHVALSAMEVVEGFESNPDLCHQLESIVRSPETGYRWDWRTRKLLRIIDPATYKKRLATFQAMADEFYRNASLESPFDPSSEYNHFELANGRMLVTSFNSCDNNDCFNRSGSINSEAIERASEFVRERNYELNAAMWHHDVEGNPSRGDYMDTRVIRLLVDRGYQLGFHGHNHKSSVSPIAIFPYSEDEMTLVGAGSLAASSPQRPEGHLREYNVVTLSDDFRSGEVHVREMDIPGVFRGGRELHFSTKITLRRPTYTRVMDTSRSGGEIVAAQEEVERALRSGRPVDALSALRKSRIHGPYARRLLLEALRSSKNWSELLKRFAEPLNVEEAVATVVAAINLKDWALADTLVDKEFDWGHIPPTIRVELHSRVSTLKGYFS